MLFLHESDPWRSLADIDLNQLIKLNHEIDPNNVRADQTILVPVGKLSERDRLILDGMGKGKYRTYPMRKGEKLSDVLSKRKITLKEFEDLNPGVNPDKIQGDAPFACSMSTSPSWILLLPSLMHHT